jgi:hypothetical protein
VKKIEVGDPPGMSVNDCLKVASHWAHLAHEFGAEALETRESNPEAAAELFDAAHDCAQVSMAFSALGAPGATGDQLAAALVRAAGITSGPPHNGPGGLHVVP